MKTPIVIAGSGRSGTTWILDALASENGLSTVFEPLHPIAVPSGKQFACRYVKQNDDAPELFLFMKKIFEGKFNSLWSSYRIRPDRLNIFTSHRGEDSRLKNVIKEYKKLFMHIRKYKLKKSHPIIVKFIRANLMLNWMSSRFDVKIVFVVRHPAAVVASRIQLMGKIKGKSWGLDNDLYLYLKDKRLFEDHLSSYLGMLDVFSLSRISQLTILWCIENIIPIIDAQKKGYYIVFYEDLVMEPEAQWGRISSAMGLKAIPSMYTIAKPSQQAPISMANHIYNEKQLTRWMKYFDQEQLDQIDSILQMFHLDLYSIHDPMPISRFQRDRHNS